MTCPLCSEPLTDTDADHCDDCTAVYCGDCHFPLYGAAKKAGVCGPCGAEDYAHH